MGGFFCLTKGVVRLTQNKAEQHYSVAIQVFLEYSTNSFAHTTNSMLLSTCKKVGSEVSSCIYTLANHSTEVPREEQPAAQPERPMCKYEWFETSTVTSVLEI